MVAAFGRSQKRGGGLRPPPLFWVHILSKYYQNVDPGQYFDNFGTILEPPEDNFLTIFRGSSKVADFEDFDMF